ncbi:uncharacterized protein [Musca autumnalis]|uniref:uncharacterized protein n=1 Tax=Musca autumnalis TaxID=221902 RepID=UPI003CF0D2CB
MSYNEQYKCPMCDTRHALQHCRAFLQMSPQSKSTFVRVSLYCVNCLGMGHVVLHCPAKKGCRTCTLPHHTLMHPLDTNYNYWLKMSAQVKLRIPGVLEPWVEVKVLLDPRHPDSTIMLGSSVGEDETKLKPLNKAVLTANNNGVRTYTTYLRKSTRRLVEPREPIDPRQIRQTYRKAEVADPEFQHPGVVNVVLGADAAKGVFLGLPIALSGRLYAQNTIFGWAFFGAVPLRA